MAKPKKEIREILNRYAILILILIPNISLFYFIFKPLTIYLAYFLFSIFFKSAILSNNEILISNIFNIKIIGACIAGSAYFLLTILNLTTPNIKFKTRIKSLLLSFLIFLSLNIIRILLLGIMFVNKSLLLETFHKVFWYLLSTIFVVAIWFIQVKIFNIKKIPIYSDIKTLYKYIK